MQKETHYMVKLIILLCTSCSLTESAKVNGSLATAHIGLGIGGVRYVTNATATTIKPTVNIPHLNQSDRHRIIGGVETNRNEFPFIVSFARQGRHFCGGAIIDPEWVLTAAHCASEPDFEVTAGEHNLAQFEGPEQKTKAIKVIRHSMYNPETYEDDICLVKVSPPFSYNQYVKPFAVPTTHYVASGDGTVAGWGTEDEAYQVVSPVLRKVTVPLVPSMECAKQYGSYFHPLKMMCAGLTEGGKDACQGDSGGPLMCDDYSKGATLCGVVSFGLGCARPELAGVYTKVAYYSDWIGYHMKKNPSSGGDAGRRPNPTTTPYRPTHNENPWGNVAPGHVIYITPIEYTKRPHHQHHPHHHHQIPTTPSPRSGSTRLVTGTSLPFLFLAIYLVLQQ